MYDRKGAASNPNETTRLLQHTLKTAEETSELGRRTNIELQRQEEQLNKAIDNTSGVQNVMTQAREILQEVRCRRMTRTVYLWLICGALTLMNCLLIALMIYNRGKQHTSLDTNI